ncbi:MAG: glycosyltransferase, partial [Lachnospiraceae bacterium]|nr:glycosyltransferase [Lachnospiraceae bacterium]
TILIVDNGSYNLFDIKEMALSFEGHIILIENGNNLGIGKALNIALAWSKNNKYRWLLTLDQDSVCAPDYFDHVLPMLEISDVGIIYPTIIDKGQSDVKTQNKSAIGNCINFFKRNAKRTLCGDIVLPITSGSVINVDIAAKVGGFCDTMFIDGVDFDFALKIYKAQFKVIPCKRAKLYHNLGNPAAIDIGCGVLVTASGHNPMRCYYMNKNAWYLFYKHHDKYLGWTIYNILAVFFMGLRNAVVTKCYKKYICQTLKGQIKGISLPIFLNINADN